MSKAKGNNPAADSVEARLRAQGYITIREVSERTGKDISTVNRWANNEEIDCEEILGRKYVTVRSVVEKIGVKASVLIGLITQEQATKIQKESKAS